MISFLLFNFVMRNQARGALYTTVIIAHSYEGGFSIVILHGMIRYHICCSFTMTSVSPVAMTQEAKTWFQIVGRSWEINDEPILTKILILTLTFQGFNSHRHLHIILSMWVAKSNSRLGRYVDGIIYLSWENRKFWTNSNKNNLNKILTKFLL